MQHLPIAESKAAFPLVNFSHGNWQHCVAYSAIVCSLVRQVSPHTHTAAIICGLMCHLAHKLLSHAPLWHAQSSGTDARLLT